MLVHDNEYSIHGKKCKYCGKESCYLEGSTCYHCPYCGTLIVISALVNKHKYMDKDKKGYVVLKECDFADVNFRNLYKSKV